MNYLIHLYFCDVFQRGWCFPDPEALERSTMDTNMDTTADWSPGLWPSPPRAFPASTSACQNLLAPIPDGNGCSIQLMRGTTAAVKGDHWIFMGEVVSFSRKKNINAATCGQDSRRSHQMIRQEQRGAHDFPAWSLDHSQNLSRIGNLSLPCLSPFIRSPRMPPHQCIKGVQRKQASEHTQEKKTSLWKHLMKNQTLQLRFKTQPEKRLTLHTLGHSPVSAIALH